MKHRTSLPLPVLWCLFPILGYAQGTICDPLGNVVIYSNYDGGALSINVDQDIPDLRIGIVSYEFSRITISGPFAGNITAIWYAGYNADNDHCALGTVLNTTITGVPPGTDSIMLYPPATWANTNGYGSIICNYSCDITTSQGGCNTADQIAHFFLTQWGGPLRYHFTQYGCWGNGYSISGGGNCCENPLATQIDQQDPPASETLAVTVIYDQLILNAPGPFIVVDGVGRMVIMPIGSTAIPGPVNVDHLPVGCYAIRQMASGSTARFVIDR